MAEVDRRCPHCGAPATARFCGECGTEIPPIVLADPVGDQLFTHQPPSAGTDEAPTLPTLPRTTGPAPQARVGPDMFPTEQVRAAPPAPGAGFGTAGFSRPAGSQAWSQSEPGVNSGWTGVMPVVPAGPPLDPNQRRRRAVYGVLAVALATAVVIVAALLIAPTFNSGKNSADRSKGPAPQSSTAVSSSAPASSGSLSPGPTGGATIALQPGPSATSAGTATSTVAQSAVRSTVTVTDTATSSTSSGVAKTNTSNSTKPTATATPKTTPSKSTPKPTTSKAPDFGVPTKNISCSSGFIVQLASDVSAPAFTQRVSSLKSQGEVPAGALAADSAKSCQLFTGATKTMILYAGPYQNPYDGCAVRLAGPADALIRGANPATSHTYYSCLCPSSAHPPNLGPGSSGAWVGELQRAVADRLGYSIPDLGNHWGSYTAGTKSAVSRFQSAHHLPPTGVADARTWTAVRAASC